MDPGRKCPALYRMNKDELKEELVARGIVTHERATVEELRTQVKNERPPKA